MGIFSKKTAIKNQTPEAVNISPSKKSWWSAGGSKKKVDDWDYTLPCKPDVDSSLAYVEPVAHAFANVSLRGNEWNSKSEVDDDESERQSCEEHQSDEICKPAPVDIIRASPSAPKQFTLVATTNTAPEVDAYSMAKIYELDQLSYALDTLRVTGNGLKNAAKIDAEVNDQLVLITTEVALLKESYLTAFGHRQNVQVFTNFVTALIHTLDAQAKHGGLKSAKALSQLYDLVADGCALVQNCSKPGWLARMARCDMSLNAKFASIHQHVLEILTNEGWDKAQELAGKRLDLGDYEDVAFKAKQILKSMGKGLNMDLGMRRIKTDVAARKTVAETLGVPPESLVMEVVFDLQSASIMALPDGPMRDVECRRVFQPYASPEEDHIPFDGFYQLMEDLSMLEHLPANERAPAVRSAFVTADSNYDGFINFEEFRAFYTRQPMSIGQVQLRLQTTLKVERRLRETFKQYTSYGVHRAADTASASGLDSTQFGRLCKDCGLLGGRTNREHANIIFQSVKGQGARRISFPQFVGALSALAAFKGKPLGDIVCSMHGLEPELVKATNYVRLHDDKSTYTGIYARGGPDTRAVRIDLEQVVSRPGGGMYTPRSPAPKVPSAHRLEVTKPESPRLATAMRARPFGECPLTPGRGASVGQKGKKEEPAVLSPRPCKFRAGPPNLATAARAEARTAANASAATPNNIDNGSPTKSSKPKVKGLSWGSPTKSPSPARTGGRQPASTTKSATSPFSLAKDNSPTKKQNTTPASRTRSPSPVKMASGLKVAFSAEPDSPGLSPVASAQPEFSFSAGPAAPSQPAAEPVDWMKKIEDEKAELASIQTPDIVVPHVEPVKKVETAAEAEQAMAVAFNNYATIDVYDEEEAVLDEDGFRDLLIDAEVTTAGVGLPASSIISIFDISANAVSSLMTFNHFQRSLQLISARTALAPEDLKLYIANSKAMVKKPVSKAASVVAPDEELPDEPAVELVVESVEEQEVVELVAEDREEEDQPTELIEATEDVTFTPEIVVEEPKVEYNQQEEDNTPPADIPTHGLEVSVIEELLLEDNLKEKTMQEPIGPQPSVELDTPDNQSYVDDLGMEIDSVDTISSVAEDEEQCSVDEEAVAEFEMTLPSIESPVVATLA